MAEATEPVKVETIAEVTEAVPAADGGNVWPDEAAESAFLAEARTNGETPQVATVTAAEPEVENETDGKELPPLDDAMIEEILRDGANRAREVAAATMDEVRSAMGLQ